MLFVITLLVNGAARLIIARRKEYSGPTHDPHDRRHPPVRLAARATLPKWFPWAVAGASAALGYGISAAAGLHSDIQWALIAALLFVGGSFAVSAKVEGAARPGTAPRPAWCGWRSCWRSSRSRP